ncbi:hypothetical protein D9756_006409 [Leucocoprinus leucothites]|uniref:Nephrocystin 3-like N-terminal domain-containing protein n=1 Tax=Leucocoprinus leucothites TaxID=201217 RepID=A0A8H5G293_9AGAR|nr:hypothetical protein D9756_006409 [Leucoagaricus leucothites]
MAVINNPQNFVINNSEFINNNSGGSNGIDVLLEASTPEATVDAGEREYDPRCSPGTREQHIKDVTSWATTSDSDQWPIYWMKGPAGVGKSAIAQTCAKAMKDSGHLGASFFFSINGRRKDHTRFFPTLAYQLATTLPDYREVVDRRVHNDKTLVSKTLSSQFESLIVEPLQALKEQGKEVRRRPIFIDGLDECESQDAQAEIIKLIAASVQAKSTPFCWAIFSRAEPQIASIFALVHVSSLCCVVHLPISRDNDKDIELYFRDGFKNMLQRRNMVLSSSWPTEEDIKKLVDAAAGLFAYAATVLRFIDKHEHTSFQDTLQAVLDAITKPGSHPLPIFSNLDSLYTLILERVPDGILRPMKVLLYWVALSDWEYHGNDVAVICNRFDISEATFKSICHYLQAVVAYREPSQSCQELVPTVDLAQSFYHQGSSFKLSGSLKSQLLEIHGTISFLHKSFLEFLTDPTRSSVFYVQSSDIQDESWDCMLQQSVRCASGYVIEGSRLELASGTASSSTLLSWPQGNEFVDSFLASNTIQCFLRGSRFFLTLALFPDLLSPEKELHHRKILIAERLIYGLGLHANSIEYTQIMEGTTFRCLTPEEYEQFDLAKFRAHVKRGENAGLIKAFHPHAPSIVASMNNLYSQNKPGKRCGLYKFGHGEKSVIWYWEYDTRQRYYHEFWTVDFERAMRIYKAEKFTIWDESGKQKGPSPNSTPQRLSITKNSSSSSLNLNRPLAFDEDIVTPLPPSPRTWPAPDGFEAFAPDAALVYEGTLGFERVDTVDVSGEVCGGNDEPHRSSLISTYEIEPEVTVFVTSPARPAIPNHGVVSVPSTRIAENTTPFTLPISNPAIPGLGETLTSSGRARILEDPIARPYGKLCSGVAHSSYASSHCTRTTYSANLCSTPTDAHSSPDSTWNGELGTEDESMEKRRWARLADTSTSHPLQPLITTPGLAALPGSCLVPHKAVYRTPPSFPLSRSLLVQEIMAFFSDAQNLVVNGGEFTSNNISNISTSNGIDVLLEASTPEAAVDAGEREYDPRCYPGTREQHIKDVTSWATTSDSDQLPIYWMKGPAGVGKSAIAQTCAKAMKDSGYLGAAFFFSINGRRKDHTRFFPTLAYQLATTLPDYREIVDRRVHNDKTLVTKTLSTQFKSLIVEPLRALKEQGREVRRRPIFIDGLDECESQDAQAEIIKLIAASVQAKSTPFCWAIFSRAEPQIASTFALVHISSLCCVVYLPISRDNDKDIELYFRDGFKNMLQRRNLVLSLSWPTEEDIKKLVDAAAGLFAYAATVLRFIDKHEHTSFQDTLQAVLDAITKPGSHPLPIFSNLDSLYTLILERVPDGILRPMKVLLFRMTLREWDDRGLGVAYICNLFGISEATFKSISHYLQAVVAYQEPSQPIQELVPTVDLAQSFYHQGSSFKLSGSLKSQLLEIHGTISFLHKSFLEFLTDPTRSSVFYVQSSDIQDESWDCMLQQSVRCASGYVIEGSRLELASGTASSSTLLSWPQGSEFVESFLALYTIQCFLCDSHFFLTLALFPDLLSPGKELHHHKALIAEKLIYGLGWHADDRKYVQIMEGTTFRCLMPEEYEHFDLAEFQARIKRGENVGLIKAFHPRTPSIVASMNNLYSQNKPGKRRGLYKLGHGEKSVIWYWEYDMKKQYFHEFITVDYERAMRIYKAEKFRMWDESWVPPS